MFDEIMRELRRLEKPVSVPIDMPLDDKGYYDRKCPHSECGADFKVLFDDWKEKVPDEFGVCPKCGKNQSRQTSILLGNKSTSRTSRDAYMSRQLNDALRTARLGELAPNQLS